MKRKPIDRPISYLSLFATALNGDLSAVQEQYETLLPAKDKPSSLNDEIINRVIRVHEEKQEFIANYKRQFKLWRQETLTAQQLIILEDLEEKLPKLKAVNGPLLRLRSDLHGQTLPDQVSGEWSVDLETEHGQLIGRVHFEVLD